MELSIHQAIVHETHHIKKGYLSESTEPGEKEMWRLKTDGVNLQVLWRYADMLDLKRAYTNNIHAMANAYGIEAACKAIIKVTRLILSAYYYVELFVTSLEILGSCK